MTDTTKTPLITETKDKVVAPKSVQTFTKKEVGGVNAAKLPWPQDKQGITSRLKREIARSIGRVQGDEAKRKLVEEVLAIGNTYLKDKFKDQVNRRENAVALAKEKQAKELAQNKASRIAYAKDQKRIAEQAMKEAEVLQAAIDAESAESTEY